jgi:hypothetical protein
MAWLKRNYLVASFFAKSSVKKNKVETFIMRRVISPTAYLMNGVYLLLVV